MFEQTFVDGTGKTTKPWTIALSFMMQFLLVGVLILIPLIWHEGLVGAQLSTFLVAPSPPPPPPPPPPPSAPIKVVKVIPRQFDGTKLMAPKVIPKDIAVIKEEEMPPAAGPVGVVGGVPGGVPGGTAGGVIGGVIGGVPSAAPPPPPPPPVKVVEKPKQVGPIRVGGNVTQANLISQQKPVYPPLAKQARISGTVRFEAIISKDGTIQQLKVISGHPLLIPSAQEAVKNWKYRPTQLNGEAVEVQTTIDVNFTLSN